MPKNSTLESSLEETKPTYNKDNKLFGPEEWEGWSKNEHGRFFPNSKIVGHALIGKANDGSLKAIQFKHPKKPTDANYQTPSGTLLEDIEKIKVYGQTRYQARTPNKIHMVSRRKLKLKLKIPDDPKFNDLEKDDKGFSELDLAYFSPRGNKSVFWGGSGKNPEILSDKLSDRKKQEILDELEELPIDQKIKGGKWLKLEPESILQREIDKDKPRVPTQNAVMGLSAVDAVKEFIDSYEGEISDPLRKALQKSAYAPLTFKAEGQPRDEWLHLYGHSLTPTSIDPQRSDNLGAAPKWLNTKMMILERLAKYYGLYRTEVEQAIKPTFLMLLGSDIVEEEDFRLAMKDGEKFLIWIQQHHAWSNPAYAKGSDIAQIILVTLGILEENKLGFKIPSSVSIVVDKTKRKFKSRYDDLYKDNEVIESTKSRHGKTYKNYSGIKAESSQTIQYFQEYNPPRGKNRKRKRVLESSDDEIDADSNGDLEGFVVPDDDASDVESIEVTKDSKRPHKRQKISEKSLKPLIFNKKQNMSYKSRKIENMNVDSDNDDVSNKNTNDLEFMLGRLR